MWPPGFSDAGFISASHVFLFVIKLLFLENAIEKFAINTFAKCELSSNE